MSRRGLRACSWPAAWILPLSCVGLAAWTSAESGLQPHVPVPLRSQADADIEAYLQERGLTSLLVDHLWARFQTAPSSEHERLAERLGALYVQLLSAAGDDAERSRWQTRAEELIAAAPGARNLHLRFLLARALYPTLEEAGERVRLRLDPPGEREQVVARLGELSRRLDDIANAVARRVEMLDRSTVNPDDPARLREQLDQARSLRSEAMYFAGWANVYVARLTGSREAAQAALRQLGWITGTGENRPARMGDLDAEFLKYDHVARAAVGVAMAFSALGDHQEAVSWIDRVSASREIPEAVRQLLLRRRIEVLAAAVRWSDLYTLVDQVRGRDGTGRLDTVAARTLAILALESAHGADRQVTEHLAREAMRDLVVAQQFAQVMDLARRYGPGILGDRGYLAGIVRALLLSEEAEAMHAAQGGQRDAPGSTPEVRTAFESAAAAIDVALQEHDAPRAGQPLAQVLVQSGRAWLGAAQFPRAADRFVRAAQLTGVDAHITEEAHWLVLVALDHGVRYRLSDGSSLAEHAQMSSRLTEASVHFLRTYPRSTRSAALLVHRGDVAGIPDEEVARVLLGVPRGDELYLSARRLASRALYRMFRSVQPEQRAFAATRFVPVGEEVFEAERREAIATSGEPSQQAAQRMITTGRQLLDALLSVDPSDSVRAQAVLDALTAGAAYAGIDLAEAQWELRFRRFQIVLARDGLEAAAQIADEFDSGEPVLVTGGGVLDARARYAVSARRQLYQRAAEAYERTPSDRGPERLRRAAEVTVHGRHVIAQFGPLVEALPSQPAAFGVVTRVAGAAAELGLSGDAEARALALALDREILRAIPNSMDALRRVAMLSEVGRDRGTAIDAWRTLSQGLPEGSADWFQARFNFFRVLAESDRDADRQAARVAIHQHTTLYPTYGPEPWGSRIRGLEQVLGGPLRDGTEPGPGRGGRR